MNELVIIVLNLFGAWWCGVSLFYMLEWSPVHCFVHTQPEWYLDDKIFVYYRTLQLACGVGLLPFTIKGAFLDSSRWLRYLMHYITIIMFLLIADLTAELLTLTRTMTKLQCDERVREQMAGFGTGFFIMMVVYIASAVFSNHN